jgi:hypothetical protein
MKSDIINAPTTMDRFATLDEIRAAVLPFPDPIEECDAETIHEIASDTGGYVRISAAIFETALMVEELTREQDA